MGKQRQAVHDTDVTGPPFGRNVQDKSWRHRRCASWTIQSQNTADTWHKGHVDTWHQLTLPFSTHFPQDVTCYVKLPTAHHCKCLTVDTCWQPTGSAYRGRCHTVQPANRWTWWQSFRLVVKSTCKHLKFLLNTIAYLSWLSCMFRSLLMLQYRPELAAKPC